MSGAACRHQACSAVWETGGCNASRIAGRQLALVGKRSGWARTINGCMRRDLTP